ncbi:MAG: ribosome maturation factor RimP [Gammaproteobacteria bacterium]|nr:ribosome maturation factor RimP [Gammaproteobacteria bacterium]
MAASLRDLLATTVSSMDYEFVGYEMHGQGRGSVLRIYIDNGTGVTADDCSKVSRQVSAMLDVEDPIQGKYTLEVSSPGLDRPLFEIAHYQKVVGSRVKVRLNAPVNDRRNFVGVLLRVEGDNIHLLMETEEEVVLPFSNIEKAKVIADIAG